MQMPGAIRAGVIWCGAPVALLIGAPASALACSCMMMSPCQALWSIRDQGPTIFEATVESIEHRSVQQATINGERVFGGSTKVVHLKDVRELLGDGARTITTSGDGASCGYNFTVGRRYVIDAYSWNGGLSTGSCSQTKPIEEAGPLLAYIASLCRPSPGATVTGTVSLSTMASLLDRHAPPRPPGLAGVRVILDGVTTTTTTTREDGSFAFDALPAGSYRLSVDADGSRAFKAARPSEFMLPNTHACYVAYLPIELAATIEGTVVDGAGRPVEGAHMALRRADALDPRGIGEYVWSTSDAFGRYQFANIPPGRYVVGLNIDSGPRPDSTHLPAYVADPSGQPEIIDFPLGGHRVLTPVVARAPASVTVTGRVVWPDGSPGTGMIVMALGHGEARFQSGSHQRTPTDADGRFSFVLFEGQPHLLRAFIDPDRVTRTEDYDINAEVDIVATPGDVTLVLQRRR